MGRQNDSQSGPKSSTSKHRAARACIACRARKVRCDVVIQSPCGNCRWNDQECITPARRQKKLSPNTYVAVIGQSFSCRLQMQDYSRILVQTHKPCHCGCINSTSVLTSRHLEMVSSPNLHSALLVLLLYVRFQEMGLHLNPSARRMRIKPMTINSLLHRSMLHFWLDVFALRRRLHQVSPPNMSTQLLNCLGFYTYRQKSNRHLLSPQPWVSLAYHQARRVIRFALAMLTIQRRTPLQ